MMGRLGSNGKPAGRLVLVGSIVMDLLLYVDRLPDRGSDVLASQCHISPGGGFNILHAAHQLGMRTAYGGIIGTGRWGSSIQDALTEYSIDRLAAFTSEDDNGFVIGMVEPDGERTFITYPGCESMLQTDHLAEIEKHLQHDDTIYISGYEFLYPVSGELLSDWIIHASKKWGIAIDLGPLVGNLSDNALGHIMSECSLLTLNLKEAETVLEKMQQSPDARPSPSDRPTSDLTKTTPDINSVTDYAASLAETIHSYLKDEATLIIRIGAYGCVIVPSMDCTTISTEHPGATHTPTTIPSRPPREIVDTTGAGDVHTAAYLASIAYGMSNADAAWIANIAASMSVEKKGGAACPSIDKLNDCLAATHYR